MAWLKGLKTTYYLRSMGATSTEKSTVEKSNLNAVKKVDEKILFQDQLQVHAAFWILIVRHANNRRKDVKLG
jgi:hypothetical protein